MLRLTRQILRQQRFERHQPFKQIVAFRQAILFNRPRRGDRFQAAAFAQPFKDRVSIVPFAQFSILDQPESITAVVLRGRLFLR